jgi:hypothetical protein
MKIPIIVQDKQYSEETINKWKTVWNSICEMCYNGTNIQEEIITEPGYFQVDEEVIPDADEKEQARFYGERYANNDEQITLEHTWKEYSQTAGSNVVLKVIPEFKRLHVPVCLYYTLGVYSWFAECFPNCKVTFWEVKKDE